VNPDRSPMIDQRTGQQAQTNGLRGVSSFKEMRREYATAAAAQAAAIQSAQGGAVPGGVPPGVPGIGH
jgi:hypothetical protein